MADLKSRVRDLDVTLDTAAKDPAARDPFAELAEIFESELGREAIRQHADTARRSRTGSGFDAPTIDAIDREFEAAFSDALDEDVAHGRTRGSASRLSPAQESAYRSWIAPRVANPVTGSPLKSFALDEALEDAIRSLSKPANPRSTVLAETQSFAPERVVEDARQRAPEAELDEFDELIASELANLSNHPGYRRRLQPVEAPLHDAYDVGAYDDESHPEDAASNPTSGDDIAVLDGPRRGTQGADHEVYDKQMADPAPRRRAMFGRLAGASILTIAILGTAGVYLFQRGGLTTSGPGEALLIKADAEPYKIVPKEPGGRSIPNQNKAVYERVANPGTKDPAPSQQKLLAETEEPMELPVEQSYKDLPGVELGEADGLDVKAEDRIDTAAAVPAKPVSAAIATDTALLEPRKVRTMVVRPDGTIVPSTAEAAPRIAGAPALIEASSRMPEPVQAQPPQAAVATLPGAGGSASQGNPISQVLGTLSPPETEAIGVPVMIAEPPAAAASNPVPAMPAPARLVAPLETPPVQGAPQAEQAETVAPPVKVAVAPTARPAHTPAAAAAEVAPPPPARSTEVASLQQNGDPFAPPPTGGSGYFVQISSQPTQGLAQQSLRKLGARFSDLISGRSLGIKAAEIPGKGTFYRVRVSANSKDDAVALCSRLKTAGGNCFIAR